MKHVLAPMDAVNGNSISKNWGLNLAGQILPLLAAVATIPYLVRGLGTERFGVLSIAYAVLGPLSLLDLGLGRATTKFIAECLGRRDLSRLPVLFWSSLWAQCLLGAAGMAAMIAAVPLLTDVLKISPALIREVHVSFYLLALSAPFLLAGNSMRGVLEAAQRFDLTNYVRVPVNLAGYLLPAISVFWGFRLPGVMLLVVASRAVAAFVYLALCFRIFPSLRSRFSAEAKSLQSLLKYGGWVTVSNVLGPLMAYLDRFLIGTVLPMSSVAYYSAPNEAISKAAVVPSSLVTTLFPAFAHLDASGSREKLRELSRRSLKLLMIAIGPWLLLVFVFAHELLGLWLGADFAARSTLILQIFTVGVFFNALAFIPFSLLQGLGRPDLAAKLHLIEMPFYVVGLWLLLGRLGLTGAAIAWTLRMSLEAVLLFAIVFRMQYVPVRALWNAAYGWAFALMSGLGILLGVFRPSGRPLAQAAVALIFLSLFAVAAWKRMLDAKEKELVRALLGSVRSRVGNSRPARVENGERAWDSRMAPSPPLRIQSGNGDEN